MSAGDKKTRDWREIGGHAAMAAGVCGSWAAWKRCPKGTVKLTHESQPRRNLGLRGYSIYRCKIAPADTCQEHNC